MTSNLTKPGRPKEFDDRLVRYMPGLYALAGKLGFHEEAKADLVTDTMIVAMHRWSSFREEGGFWMWLSLTMRERAQQRRKIVRREPVTVSDSEGRYSLKMSIEAPQEQQVEALDVVRAMDGRDGQALLKLAMGDDLGTIGASLGVCRERARQLCERERVRLRDAA